MEPSSLEEREFIQKIPQPKNTGFTPRPIEKLAAKKTPRNAVNLECSHVLRTPQEETATGYPSLEYQLWVEAGKINPAFPKVPDESYNSNIWRNFKRNCGFHLDTKGRNISELIAAVYPLNIPKPSKVGDYKLTTFLRDVPDIINDDKLRKVAIQRTTAYLDQLGSLKLRSQLRHPPINDKGNILPPEHYRRYPQVFQPIRDTPTTEFLLSRLKEAANDPPAHGSSSAVTRKPRKAAQWQLSLSAGSHHYEALVAKLQTQRQQHSQRPRPPQSLHWDVNRDQTMLSVLKSPMSQARNAAS